MRIANVSGRASILLGDELADIEHASGGAFGPDIQSVYEKWDTFTDFARGVDRSTGPLIETALGSPSPRPRQVFAIGLNYRAHAEESGMAIPEVPATFTKYPSSLSGPFDDIVIASDQVDWEVELVAIVGRTADRVPATQGWDHIAALTVGQDISDRALQFAAGMQFSLGKSRRGFGPLGPCAVTPDSFDNPDDVALGCSIDGEIMQQARSSDLIFSIPQLIAELSSVLPLWPGDVIFTGTPSGVGMARDPKRFLRPGELLETWVEGIGHLRNRCVAP